MSKISETFVINLPLEKSMLSIRVTCLNIDMKIINDRLNFISIKGGFGFASNPVTVEISATEKDNNTLITMTGSCTGIGPIMSNKVKSTMSNIKNGILISVKHIQEMLVDIYGKNTVLSK